MQFDEMNCTILKLDGRPSFQLSPTSAAKCLVKPTNLPDPTANGNDFNLFDPPNDFKIFIHKEPPGSSHIRLASFGVPSLESNYVFRVGCEASRLNVVPRESPRDRLFGLLLSINPKAIVAANGGEVAEFARLLFLRRPHAEVSGAQVI